MKFKTRIESPRNSLAISHNHLDEKPIFEILLLILQEFEISMFQKYYSSGSDGAMKEAMWQYHFFYSCWKFFPKKIHPEVGACFKTRGLFDIPLVGTLCSGIFQNLPVASRL